MAPPLVLAIDQGTTNTKALLVAADGSIAAKASVPNATRHPRPGWAEQSPEAIWAGVRSVIDAVSGHGEIAAIAVTNQRESIVAWDRRTGEPVAPCISWQCRRSLDICERISEQGHAGEIYALTGLALDPMFPAGKVAWLLENHPHVRQLAGKGGLCIGTVDSWLAWNLTGGRVHVTDHSNASRTQLLNIDTLEWDKRLADIFGVPLESLPDIRPSNAEFGRTTDGATALPAGVPIRAMIGDSHAALYGHGIRTPGSVKATYGTGSSLMTVVERKVTSRHGLSSTIAWSTPEGAVHALEGNITVSGQAASFMAETLGLAASDDLACLAAEVDDSGGVVFVPALGGLGAPYWQASAKGMVCGLSFGTRRAHLARAAIEAIGFQVWAVLDAMERDLGAQLAELHADGGASGNAMLMQWQSDLIGRPVAVSDVPEVSAMGAAALAFAGLGIPTRFEQSEKRLAPSMADDERKGHIARWETAIRQCVLAATGS